MMNQKTLVSNTYAYSFYGWGFYYAPVFRHGIEYHYVLE